MGPLIISMAFMPFYVWEMWDVTPLTHTWTNGRTVESRAVFCLSRIRNCNMLGFFSMNAGHSDASVESVEFWKMTLLRQIYFNQTLLWQDDMWFCREFLDLDFVPQTLHMWSLCSRWCPSMCFLIFIFWSIFPQDKQDHRFEVPCTFSKYLLISFSRSSFPSLKETQDLPNLSEA